MSTGNPESPFLRFGRFDAEAWQRWIESWLVGIEVEPRIEIRDGNLLEGLVRLYRALPESSARLAFSDAAATLLTSTPLDEGSSLRLSTLIGFVSYATPTSGRAAIRKLLNMNAAWFIGEHLSSIQLQLLNAAGRYGLDVWLSRYLSAQRPGTTLQHNLACFRILAQNMREKEAYTVLDRIIPQLASNSGESALKIELIYAVGLLGCGGLLRYGIDRQLEFEYDAAWSNSEDYFSNALVAALRSHLTPQDVLEFALSYPSDATSALISFMAELHLVRLLDGGRLWTLERLEEHQFAITVRGVLYKLATASHKQAVPILQAATESSEPRLQTDRFDFVDSELRYDEFKRRLAA